MLPQVCLSADFSDYLITLKGCCSEVRPCMTVYVRACTRALTCMRAHTCTSRSCIIFLRKFAPYAPNLHHMHPSVVFSRQPLSHTPLQTPGIHPLAHTPLDPCTPEGRRIAGLAWLLDGLSRERDIALYVWSNFCDLCICAACYCYQVPAPLLRVP